MTETASSARALIRPRSTSYIALLIALSSFGPLSMSIYSPVMPAIASSLNASPDEVKFTLTTYMLGFAAGNVLFGPLSDRYGRRPVLLIGLALFTAMSVACALVTSIEQLIVLRILQGMSACVGMVISRALTRDAYEFGEMPRIMSLVSLGVNIAPAIAPIIGGYLALWFGWTSAFWALAAASGAMLLIVLAGLPETNRHRAAGFSIADFLRGSATMLRDRRFVGYSFTMGSGFAIIFGMIAGLPFLLQDRLGMPADEYGYVVILSVAGFTLGGLLNNRLIGRASPASIMRAASWCHVAGIIAIGVLAYGGIFSKWSIMLPYMLCSFGSGMMVPNANAGAVGLYPRIAGTASSLVGVCQMGMGALGTSFVALASGIGGHDRALPLLGEWLGCRSAECAVPMPVVAAMLPFAIAAVLFSFLVPVRSQKA